MKISLLDLEELDALIGDLMVLQNAATELTKTGMEPMISIEIPGPWTITVHPYNLHGKPADANRPDSPAAAQEPDVEIPADPAPAPDPEPKPAAVDMPPPPSTGRSGLVWERWEDDAIVTGRAAGETWASIAAKVGRTQGALALRASTVLKQRIAEAKEAAPSVPSLLAGRGVSWSEDEENDLIERWIDARSSGRAQTEAIRAFAAKSGRAEMAVQQRIKEMKDRIHDALAAHFRERDAAERAATLEAHIVASEPPPEDRREPETDATDARSLEHSPFGLDAIAALERSDRSERAIGQIAARYRLPYSKLRAYVDQEKATP